MLEALLLTAQQAALSKGASKIYSLSRKRARATKKSKKYFTKTLKIGLANVDALPPILSPHK